MRKTFIGGIGSTKFGRHPDVAIEVLAAQAASAALRESGIPRDKVGALYLGNFVAGVLSGQEVLAGIVGAVIAVPLVAVAYSSIRFWVNTSSRTQFNPPPPTDPTGTGAALP